MSLPFCKYFNSSQGCRFGNRCRYKHSKPFISETFEEGRNSFQNESVKAANKQVVEKEHSNLVSESFSVENEVSVKGAEFVPDSSAISNSHSKSSDCNNEDGLRNRKGNLSLAACSHITNENYNRREIDDGSLKLDLEKSKFQPRKLCYNFSRNGYCHYSYNCRFSHVQENIRGQPHASLRILSESSRVSEKSWRDTVYTAEENGEELNDLKSFNRSRHRNNIKQASASGHGFSRYRSTDAGFNQQHEQNHEAEHEGRSAEKICPFFASGRCWKGDKCKFVHSEEDDVRVTHQLQTASLDDELGSADNNRKKDSDPSRSSASGSDVQESHNVRSLKVPYQPQGVRRWKKDELDEVEAARLRRTEIEQLLKRFPKNKLKVKRDNQDIFEGVVSFTPTDPDWPFDVKNFDLNIIIPGDYPFSMMEVTLPSSEIPETVRRYVEVSILDWLEEKEEQLEESGKVELMFRPFIRWLDRNIEDFVTEGLKQLKREIIAKAAGLEFVSAKELQQRYPGKNQEEGEDEEGEEEDTAGSSAEDYSNEDESESCSDYDDDDDGDDNCGVDDSRSEKRDKLRSSLAEVDRKGMEIALKNLQLRESVATLYFDKINLSIQCERCKSTSDFITSGGRANMVQCGKCGQTQLATFRPALVHQFSPVMGYLDLDACRPYDIILQNSSAVATCMSCNKDTKLGAVQSGQMQDRWCRVCHHKFKISIDGVRFTQLEPSSAGNDLKGLLKVVIPRQKRIPKDLAIQEGKPLPNFGTCKHYKKSYRWMRFPCCGKCYPCDLCHDAQEDHEMLLANRMICGFCCKEQVFAADRPCKGCDMNLTKVRTPHWEGGQGCRDKISMSRNDKQKHRNMSKTTSKHSQKVKDMQSKKKTKLRHT